jgi:hypothetical protein
MDDVKVDCAYLNAMFNICKDIQHSKNVCPKFCGLCTLGENFCKLHIPVKVLVFLQRSQQAANVGIKYIFYENVY